MNDINPILELNNLEKKFCNGGEELVILRNIDFSLEVGKKLVIIGESGCGKSTLLNIIGALDNATSGTVKVDGMQIDTMKENELYNYRNKVTGFIFQFHYLLKELTAAENVMMPAFISGISKKEAMEKAQELLEKVNLSSRSTFYPYQLSGGERQRAAVARALINKPRLLLADEPTGNLDSENSMAVQELIFSLIEEQGTTLIMVTHDMAIAARGDITMKIVKGKLETV